jgi:4-hydroxy-tetrahydrodipicolinate synthase
MALEGVYSVLPTPFDSGDEVDHESLRRVVDLYLAAGVDGVTALGVTSEVARLSDRERDAVLDTILSHVAGRVPVVAGTTAEGTTLCLERSRQARSAGAAAVMVSPPRMPKINSDAVAKHFTALAQAVDLPIVVQDYPPISGYAMEPDLLVRVAREIPQARTIKLEDAPTPYKTARILERAQGLELRIFGGLGGMYLLEELAAGATGAMTGFAYPEILVEIVRPVPSRPDRGSVGDLLSHGRADALRVPGGSRDGDPQRDAATPRRDRARRGPAASRVARRLDASRPRPAPRLDREGPGDFVDLGLKGKVALVAGASRGLGFAVARELAAEGASVSISSRDAESLRKATDRIRSETGAEALAVAADVRSAAALEAWRDRTLEKFGRIDLLFANSGGPPAGKFPDFDDACVAERLRAPAPLGDPDGAPGDPPHPIGRRRRDPLFDILLGQGADRQSDALDGACAPASRRSPRPSRRSSPPTAFASTRSSRAGSTRTAFASSTRSTRRRRASPSRRRRSGPLPRSPSAATARPPTSAAPRRSSCPAPRRTSPGATLQVDGGMIRSVV